MKKIKKLPFTAKIIIAEGIGCILFIPFWTLITDNPFIETVKGAGFLFLSISVISFCVWGLTLGMKSVAKNEKVIQADIIGTNECPYKQDLKQCIWFSTKTGSCTTAKGKETNHICQVQIDRYKTRK